MPPLDSPEMKTWIAQVRKGLVELCVLAAHRQGEAYGYQIMQKLANVRGLAVTESTIYPILSRLVADGMLSVRSVASTEGPSRRYYALTSRGRVRLAQMPAHWKELQEPVQQLIPTD